MTSTKLVSCFALLALVAVMPIFAMHHEKNQDIVDTAIAAGDFNTLVAAVQAAGLVDTLKGDGPYTVFAPTDEAFAALPAGTVESLLEPENLTQLQAILTYHVVPGKVMASDVADLKASRLGSVNHVACEPIPLPLLSASSSACPSDP